jgi:mono/diheme cytochrome c family protein
MLAARGPSSAALITGVLLLLTTAARAAEPATVPGDPAIGAALFTGTIPMQNGGAPCGACHAVGGHGPALAASLGPDLARSFDGMAPEAVDGILQDLPFPTMVPIYTGHALTGQERAHLTSFLVSVSGAPPPTGNAVAGTAAGIAACLVVLLAMRARTRKPPTRPTLTARPPSPAPASRIGRRIGGAEPKNRIARNVGGGR